MKLKYNNKTLKLWEGQETLTLLALLGRPVLLKDDLVEILWPHPDDQPDYWGCIMSMKICKVRQALKNSGSPFYVTTVFGRGWKLT